MQKFNSSLTDSPLTEGSFVEISADKVSRMNEYIKREDVLDIVSQYCADDDGSCSKADVDLREMLDEIEALPAVDVHPAKQGRWIKQKGFWNKSTVKCSLCGNYLDMNGVNGGRGDANFCPNCGKIMIKDVTQNDN